MSNELRGDIHDAITLHVGADASDEIMEWVDLYTDDRIAQARTEVAERAILEAADELQRWMRTFPQEGRHTRAGWAVQALRDPLAARIARQHAEEVGSDE